MKRKSDIQFTLDWVASFLKKGGASSGDILIARKVGKELLESQDVNPMEAPRFVLDHLKSDYEITTPALDSDQENATAGGLKKLQSIKNNHTREKGLKAWFHFGRNKEGD